MASMSPAARVIIQYEIPRTRPDWTLPEEPVPESQPHDQTVDLLKAILLAWVARTGRSAQVARNLAVRWEPAHQTSASIPICVSSSRAHQRATSSIACVRGNRDTFLRGSPSRS
jgi:hypothetical protein